MLVGGHDLTFLGEGLNYVELPEEDWIAVKQGDIFLVMAITNMSPYRP